MRQPALQHSSTPNAVHTSSAGHPSILSATSGDNHPIPPPLKARTSAALRAPLASSAGQPPPRSLSSGRTSSLDYDHLDSQHSGAAPTGGSSAAAFSNIQTHASNPAAPSAKPPILRLNDLRHRLEHRRARRWPLASSIFLSTATVLLSRPVSKLASRSGNLYGYRPADQARLELASRSGNLTTNPGHPAISLPAATFDIRRTLLAHHDDIPSPGGHADYLLRKWLPRRYRRSSAHNSIKGCAAFHLPAWSPSHHAHMRALALAHAQAPTPILGPCSTPPSALDPFLGA